MLPILRLISVGGVFLAIVILGLALIPPVRPHIHMAGSNVPARGALIDRADHPEWRQFLILSALRRASELDRLRGLPENSEVRAGEFTGAPESTQKAAEDAVAKFAGLPTATGETASEDSTGSINVAPSATMQIDIGETSSFELPVGPAEEKPPIARAPQVGVTDGGAEEIAAPTAAGPVIVLPDVPEAILAKAAAPSPNEQANPVVIIHKRNVRRGPAKPAAAKDPETHVALPPPLNILQAIFASLAGKQSAAEEPKAKPAIARRPAVKRSRTATIR